MTQQGKRSQSGRRREAERTGGQGDSGIGGIFRGLGGFIEFLSDLAERQGEVIERRGEIGDDKGVRAVYGFTMRVGGAGGGPRVEPFGNIRKGRAGQTVVERTREPIVDVFEEDASIRIVAEMPGVEEPDIRHSVSGDVVTIRAERGDRRYEKEIKLPCAVAREAARQSFRNGILELQFARSGARPRE